MKTLEVAPQTRGATSAGVDSRTRRRVVAYVGGALVALGIVAIAVVCVVVWSGGGRWFIVNSPSMGQVAPVGSLVVSAPTHLDDLEVGDIIVFHPPSSPEEVYTHRVESITGLTASTRGDINGSIDPWTVRDQDLIGKVTVIAPTVGWAVRALPYLAVGWTLLWILTARFAPARWRAPLRVTGAALVVSLVAYILKPFVGVVLLATDLTTEPVRASLVSTGILPITVSAVGGSHISLVSGQVGSVLFPILEDRRAYQITSGLDLPLWGWVVAILLCLTPLLWTLIVGLPANPQERPRRGVLT